MVKKVIWPAKARTQLAKAYEYILKDSLQNAEKVKNDILLTNTGKIMTVASGRTNSIATGLLIK
jgi:plasmid stabilization system protein ParE